MIHGVGPGRDGLGFSASELHDGDISLPTTPYKYCSRDTTLTTVIPEAFDGCMHSMEPRYE